jgi:hypothetical protein
MDGPRRITVTLELSPEQVTNIAEHVVAILADRELAAREGLLDVEGNGPWLRGAAKIASYIDCPASRVYALASAGRIPVERDGSALVARKAELDSWLRNGGSKRP